MRLVYLSLGSNQGNRLELLAEALRRLDTPAVQLSGLSSVYETDPQGMVDQPAFLNLVAAVHTGLEPAEFLRCTQQTEQALGRVRDERWGPRTMDIDVLLFGDRVLNGAGLTVPHPRITERAFVLIPLLELDPDLPYTRALMALPDQGVRLYMDASSFIRLVRRVQ